MKIAYVSGPITANDKMSKEGNCMVAAELAMELRELGYAVICPHEAVFSRTRLGLTHEEWMKIDLKLLSVCDICVLSTEDQYALTESVGTQIEIGFCIENKIPIYRYIEKDNFEGIEKIDLY